MTKIILFLFVLLSSIFDLPPGLSKVINQENLELLEEIVFSNEGSEELSEQPEKVLGESEEIHSVLRVVDGDTIELENGKKVRYIGIDTPETKHPTKDDGCYGEEASEKNKQLVEGKSIRLEKDVSETDRYGRLLRYVYVDDVFINEHLVREGFAVSSSYPPDVKYQNKFQEAEKSARENGKGLWGEVCEVMN